jgi:hypothetical protein
MDNKLSLLNLPYMEINEPVYTFAFNKPVGKRDGFFVKIRGNIFGRKLTKR